MILYQKIRKIVIATLIGSCSTAFAQGEKPRNVTLEEFVYTGNGCPQGSISSVLSADKQSFSIIFNDFSAEATTAGERDRKVCNVRFKFNAPRWQYAVFGMQYRGYAFVEGRARVKQLTSYKLDRDSDFIRFNPEIFPRGHDDDYLLSFEVPLSNLKWSTCYGARKNLNVKTALVAAVPEARSGNGYIGVDSLDGSLGQDLTLENLLIWRRCQNQGNVGYVAICKATVANGKMVMAKATGKRPQHALKKARKKAHNRAQKKCDKINLRRSLKNKPPINCNIKPAGCSTPEKLQDL